MRAGDPDDSLVVPDAVRRELRGAPVRVAWRNELGGLTFEVGTGAERRFVKWTPPSSGIDFDLEAVRLRWAGSFVAVPRVLGQGRDGAGSWLVTAALAGENAVTARWRAEPERAVAAIGRGLRTLHEQLPRASCPFSWSREDRLTEAHRRAAAGLLDRRRWHEEHSGLSIAQALAALNEPPGADDLVVCHGDACAPNTILARDGRFAGHVDLGQLGVADRWADLAIATWSADWNYGPGWQAHLLDAYGIDPDQTKIIYYRLLWDLGP